MMEFWTTHELGKVLLCPQGNINPSEEIMEGHGNEVRQTETKDNYIREYA